MGTEHLEFITFCVGSLADALHKSASQVYNDLRSMSTSCHVMMSCTHSARTIS